MSTQRWLILPDSHVPEKCIEWSRGFDKDGYGKFHSTNFQVRVHRWIWSMVNGPIPSGLCVCHKCDNRKCYNIHHLFLGTPKDNSVDMANKGRADKGESRYNAKLTEEKVKEIRKLNGVMKERDIARIFGVSQATIWRILRRLRWKHVA